jgi:hypothetical protein
MPIDYRVDDDRRIVTARMIGELTYDQIVAYRIEVWTRKELDGYDELVDMTDVGRIVAPTSDRIRELASHAESTDVYSNSKLAIVAPSDHAFGLARMYQTYRSLIGRSNREVAVYRSMGEALTWLATDAVNAHGPAGHASC